ncbi:hypothetical protein [uncultured Aliiroseovarius sp.]|uniref:TadE/TadG family type IV pilus assembly protein n=1 Tax=uncultured Aliiroseovarius sp. TaxID=1658783 RepID=UPI002598F9E9|nr:hypothetical protein [uncultured Aliiroseovarius sp.]
MSDFMTFRRAVAQRMWRSVQHLRGFSRREGGTVTVESVIILPLLLFGVMATYTYFDAYRRQNLALKANYAIADFLSRTHNYDQTALNGLDSLFEYMSYTSDESWVRVTVVWCDDTPARCNDRNPRLLKLEHDWDSQVSEGSGLTPHTQLTMREQLGPHIPKMYDGEFLIVVETAAKYEPPFAARWTGIYPRDLVNISVTSPREFDKLCWKRQPSDCPLPPTSS